MGETLVLIAPIPGHCLPFTFDQLKRMHKSRSAINLILITKAVLLIWFSVVLVLVTVSVLFSPSVCLDDFK